MRYHTGESGINNDLRESVECWATYYDIFVQHAFGNYRDVMREVSISPMMGEYLSFVGSASFATNGGKFPDENYAREVMQLFSIGQYELNTDGTLKRNPATGKYVPTYTNEDIMAYSRVWTGYRRQELRGNIEAKTGSNTLNRIDPMLLDGTSRHVHFSWVVFPPISTSSMFDHCAGCGEPSYDTARTTGRSRDRFPKDHH